MVDVAQACAHEIELFLHHIIYVEPEFTCEERAQRKLLVLETEVKAN